ncbi:two-component system, sporulation sensor kinase A [Paenibacillus sp. 1_12]|uniref:PAS domain S-box protein n=1 Tax=Paenibacillus sp. 1_12 TaxID=1566278 RepID=UPI0008E25DA4|nr:PAS domain S-box protein [Paenibacillus sp. 1_12]SFK97659.1 two-component system, sporulation sensor kinase A [Paenibacillus sp. 1_12]
MNKDYRFADELFFQAFQHAPIGMALLEMNGTVLKANASACSMLGYSEEELTQIGFRETTYTEDFLLHLELKNQLIEGKRESYQIEKQFIHKEGSIIRALLAMSLVRNEEGKPLFFISQIVNITDHKRADNELQQKESQELYQIISENSPDIISYRTPDGIIRYVSPAIQNILGYRPDEVIGTTTKVYLHPHDAASLSFSGVLQKSEVNTFTCRVRHKDGHYIWIESSLRIIRNREGEITKLFSVGRDISARKQDELDLRKTQARLESLFHSNADPILVMDFEGRILEANAAFESMFQWKLDEIMYEDMVCTIVPEFLRNSMKLNIEQVKSGDSVIGFETIRQRKDGTLIEVSGTLSPVRDEEGIIVGVMSMYRDISERKRAVQELNAAKNQLESFIDHNVDPILIVDLEENVSRINHAFEHVFGWSASEIVGLSILNLPIMPLDLLPQIDLKLKVIKSDEPLKGYETVRRRKDGTIIPVMLSSFGMRDEHDHIHGWAVILRDITAQKQAEELVINSKKLSIAGQLAAGIAHEIRNPITAIKGFVQFMQSGSLQKQIYFDIISSEIERIEMILSELLILAKPQSVQYERKDIRMLLGQVTTLLGTQAIMNNVEIVTEFELETTHILCDENQLKQVCINFMKNAIEAMPKGGTIVIQLKSKNKENLLLRFIDQGYGIPEHILSRLGEPFYTTKEKGTGLGFMVSKKIIENHQGGIEVFSKENEGTIVEVSLPIAY